MWAVAVSLGVEFVTAAAGARAVPGWAFDVSASARGRAEPQCLTRGDDVTRRSVPEILNEFWIIGD